MNLKTFKKLCEKENVQIGDLPPFCDTTDKEWKNIIKVIGRAKRGELKATFTNK